MDPHQTPPPSSSTSDTSFPILAISILGILAVAILLLSYYIFVFKCCRNWRRLDVLLLRRPRPHPRFDESIAVYSTAVERRGLHESAIQAIPTFRFRRGGAAQGKKGSSIHECAVCLNEFQEEERIRLLPNCCHVFHIDCIDTWLQTNANCPLCRSDITSTGPIPSDRDLYCSVLQVIDQSFDREDVAVEVINVRDEGSGRTPRRTRSFLMRKAGGDRKKLSLSHAGSLGDECIDVRGKDEHLCVQPIRRSFSMDSSCDRRLYVAVQEILQKQQQQQGSSSRSSSSGSGSARARRPFFSFGHRRSSRSSVLPI